MDPLDPKRRNRTGHESRSPAKTEQRVPSDKAQRVMHLGYGRRTTLHRGCKERVFIGQLSFGAKLVERAGGR